jgi:hypothetical protein
MNIEAAIAQPSRWNLWSSLAWFNFKWIATGSGVAASLTAALLLHFFWQRPAMLASAPKLNDVAENSLSNAPVNHSSNMTIAHSETVIATPTGHNSIMASRQANGQQQEIIPFANQLASHVQSPSVAVEESGSQPVAPGKCAPFGKRKGLLIIQQRMLLASTSHLGKGNKVSAPQTDNASQGKSQIVEIVTFTRQTSDHAPFGATPMETMMSGTNSEIFGPASGGRTTSIPEQPSSYLIAQVDASMLSADMNPLSVWEVDSEGNWDLIGTVRLGTNPILIPLPELDSSAGDVSYIITGGVSDTVIGQFPSQ